MASRRPSISEYMRLAAEERIEHLTSPSLIEICKAYGADASGTRDALQKKCISLLDSLMSPQEVIRFSEFTARIYAHAPMFTLPLGRTDLQQFSGFTAHDSSRIHAGNSYVENQNNYYAPTMPMHPGPKIEFSERNRDCSALLAALEFPQMNLRRMNIEKEFPGTCTWLERTEEYTRWREPSEDGYPCTLWIKGVSGAGKSTILKYAYDKDRACPSYMPVAFFFDAKGCDLAKSAEGMFRALLHQLVSGTVFDLALHDSVTRSEMEYFKTRGWPVALLKSLFRQAILSRANRNLLPVVSYIDALDECAEDEVRELLTYFEDLASDTGLTESLRVCFSSRPYPNMTIGHCKTISLETRPEHENDIRKYALSRLRVGYFENSNSDFHRGLVSEIIERSSGVFLWVVLVTARLRKSGDQGVPPRILREHLLEIPQTLHDLFDNMIDQDKTSDCLLSIVQWVLFAQGRLRAIDLYFAVTLSTPSLWQNTVRSHWKSLDERWLRNFILTSSKGFLRPTDTKSNAYMPCEFIHESVREYFLLGGLQKLDPTLGSDVVAASHARLAQICQDFLSGAVDKQQLQLAWPSLQSIGSTSDSDALDPVPMLAYIRDKGAFLHAEIADRNGIPQTDFCNNFAFDTWLTLMQYPGYETQGKARVSVQIDRAIIMQSHAATALQVFVDNQMESLVQRVLQIHATDDEWTLVNYLNLECGLLGTALHIAVDCNNTAIIRALIGSGAHIDFCCETLGTPLDYAILLERRESVEVLLLHGATTTSEMSPHHRRKVLGVRGRREVGREGSGRATEFSQRS